MRTLVQHVSVLLARICLSLFFLWNGVDIITNWRIKSQALAEQEVQFAVPLLVLEVFCLIVGGLLLILGFRGRLGAALLVVFLVLDTMLLRSGRLATFDFSEIMSHAEDITHFLLNLALLGGLLMVLGFGSGGFSLDLVARRKKKAAS